ncbi:MAG: PCP reductase family protein [Actinobacteria bacterium]|nr:PCP reductase family protein [Actinomycetota bacterium]
MDWEPDALERLEKVPFFIRGKGKTIEEFALKRGGWSLTSGDVAEARRWSAGGKVSAVN